MANRSIGLTLTNQGAGNISYPSLGTVYANIGDTLTISFSSLPGTYWGEIAGNLDGSPNIGSGSFTSNAVPSSVHGTTTFVAFFSPHSGGAYDGTPATASGKLFVNVPNPVIGSATGNNAAAANVTVTVGATAMHTSTGTVQYSNNNSNWQTANTFSQARGTTVTYYVRFLSGGEAFSAVASTGASTAATTSATVGFISATPGVSLTTGTASIAATATTFSPALSSTTGGDTYYLTTSSSTFSFSNMVARTVIGHAQGSTVFLNAPGGSVQNTTAVSTDASEGSSRTYYLWVERNSAQGGNNSRVRATGTHNSIVVSKSGASFTTTFKDHGTNATNEYYDNSSTDTNNSTFGTGTVSIRHRVALENMNTSYYYGISSASNSYTRATIGNSAEWRTPEADGTKELLGATASRPSVGTTQTFYIWRATDTSGSNAAAVTNGSYTRTLRLASQADTTLSTIDIEHDSTSVNVEVDNTYQGHFYSLWDSASGGSMKSSVITGNAGYTTIPLSSGLPSIGNTATFHLKAKTFASRLSGDIYQDTTNSVIIRRLNTDGTLTTPTVPSGTYGLLLRNSGDSIILDAATVPIRHFASGGPVSVAGGTTPSPGTQDVTVSGLTTSTDFIVILTQLGSFPSGRYFSIPYYALKSSGKFTIYNVTGTGNTLNFNWEVFKK